MKLPAKALTCLVASVLALFLAACGNNASPDAVNPASDTASQTTTANTSSTINAKIGSEPLVLIVVGFAGDETGNGAVAYRDDFDWHNMAFESDQSVAAFYSDQSEGAFTWVPAHETSEFSTNNNTCTSDRKDDGIIHITLPRAHGHWFSQELATNPDESIDINTVSDEQATLDADFETCTVEALREAAKYINFSLYDKDNSYTIDGDELGVGIIFAGYDNNGDWMNVLDKATYPCMQAQAYGPFNTGINLGSDIIPNRVITMGEMMTRVPEDRTSDDSVDETVIEVVANPLSTLDHELGHYLDLPDYYDTSYDTSAPWAHWNAGSLSTMDIGSVLPVSKGNNTYEYSASRLDPFSRIKLGWLQPQVIDTAGTYEVRADGTNTDKNVLLIKTERENEYFLIENRQPTGFDAAFQDQTTQEKTGGIVVWHVDEKMYDDYLEANQVNLPTHHPALTVQYLLSLSSIPTSGLPETEAKHTLSFADSVAPDIACMFWDRTSAQSRFAELGVDALQLWTYGTGNTADDPKAREYCNIYLKFPDESADVMHVEITL